MREGVHEYTSTRADSQSTYFGPFMILPFTPSLASNPAFMRLFTAVLALLGVGVGVGVALAIGELEAVGVGEG